MRKSANDLHRYRLAQNVPLRKDDGVVIDFFGAGLSTRDNFEKNVTGDKSPPIPPRDATSFFPINRRLALDLSCHSVLLSAPKRSYFLPPPPIFVSPSQLTDDFVTFGMHPKTLMIFSFMALPTSSFFFFRLVT